MMHMIRTYIFCIHFVHHSTITIMVMVRSFEVMSDKFNMDKICTLVVSSSKNMMMMMCDIITTAEQ
jgi:hypothetical protein